MIQGGSLSKHTGDARGGWSWETIAPVAQTITGSTATITFNASLLKSTKVKMSLWQMSADWQTRTAFFPADSDKAATMDVAIDGSKLHADATMMPIDPAPMHANINDSPVARFHAARSYCCYYGPGKFNALSHVDAAILHTPGPNARVDRGPEQSRRRHDRLPERGRRRRDPHRQRQGPGRESQLVFQQQEQKRAR